MHAFQVIRVLDARRACWQSHLILLFDHEFELLRLLPADLGERDFADLVQEEEAGSHSEHSHDVGDEGVLEGRIAHELEDDDPEAENPEIRDERKGIAQIVELVLGLYCGVLFVCGSRSARAPDSCD